MKKTIVLTIICLFLLFFSGQAKAAYVTSGILLENCQSDKAEKLFSCMNYIAGVIDYHVFMQSLGTTPTTDFCLPNNLSIEEASVVVIAYLKKSPQHTYFTAPPAIILALQESFPCAPAEVPKKKVK